MRFRVARNASYVGLFYTLLLRYELFRNCSASIPSKNGIYSTRPESTPDFSV
jgi:hypothetical protein